MRRKYLDNQKGMSLLGTMIAAAVGLLVVMGVSKALLNFAEQTSVNMQKSKLATVSRNIDTLLRDPDMWDTSMSKMKSGCGYPGKNSSCPLELFNHRGGKKFSCSSGKVGEAIAFMTTDGALIDNIDCSKCKGSESCGIKSVKKKNLVRFRVSYKSAPAGSSAPTFKYQYEDFGFTKSVSKEMEVKNSKQITVNIDQIRCGNGEILTGLTKSGQPVCANLADLIKQANLVPVKQGSCPDNQVLTGYDTNGNPKCKTLVASAAPPPPPAPRGGGYTPPPPSTIEYCRVVGAGLKTHYSHLSNRYNCQKKCKEMTSYRKYAACYFGKEVIRRYPMCNCKITNMRGTNTWWEKKGFTPMNATSCVEISLREVAV